MTSLKRLTRYGLLAMATMFTFGLLALVLAYLYLAPGFPSVGALKDVELQVPLRIYSRDGALIAEYGEKKRMPMRFNEVSELLTPAVLAADLVLGRDTYARRYIKAYRTMPEIGNAGIYWVDASFIEELRPAGF